MRADFSIPKDPDERGNYISIKLSSSHENYRKSEGKEEVQKKGGSNSIKAYPAFGRSIIGEEMRLRSISVFDTKASEETPHAGDNLQEENPNSPSIAKHLSALVNSHAHSILNKKKP